MQELSLILSPLVTVLVALLLFLCFQRHQIRMARHTIVRQLEKDSEAVVKAQSAESFRDGSFTRSEFRSVLDNVPPWRFEADTSSAKVAGWSPPRHQLINGVRHWQIRPESPGACAQYLASESLQEVLLWFRRIEQAHKDQIVRGEDLCGMWRFILPLTFSGRITYFSKYFQGERDIGSMINIANATLRHCLKLGWTTPLRYFNTYVTEEDLEILTRNKRDRNLHDRVRAIGKGQ